MNETIEMNVDEDTLSEVMVNIMCLAHEITGNESHKLQELGPPYLEKLVVTLHIIVRELARVLPDDRKSEFIDYIVNNLRASFPSEEGPKRTHDA